MSKIARIYQGINEIQKYYQVGILQRLFFDWKHYIGTELNIEYAKECAGRNVVISGKTIIQGIPSDYTILDYIECTGNQYIDTGFKANTTTTKFVGAFTPTQQVMGGLLGSRNYTSSGSSACNIFVTDAGKFRGDWANGSYTAEIDYVVDTKYEMEITRGTLVINDTTYSFPNRESVDQLGNFLIGTFNNVTTPYTKGFVGYIHECKLYSNDILICNFVPVIRNSDNEVGMYDTVTNTFYTNAGVNSFIAGEKVVNDDIESVGKREFVKSKNLCPYLENGSIDINGEETNISGDVRSPFIHLNAGTYVTSNAGVVRATHICIYNLNKQFEENLSKVSTFSLDSNKYVRLYGASSNRDKFQLELGDTPTDYEPFYEYYPVTIRNYNYKCGTDNIVLPNGVKNSIDTIDGKKVHVQRVRKIVVDGSDDENWGTSSITPQEETIIFQSTIIAETVKPNSYLISNKFNKISNWNDTETITMGGTGNVRLYIGINRNKLDTEDLKGFEKWLSENPVTVWYELATPIYTYLESGLYDNITLPTSNIKNEIYLENGKWYHKRNIGKVIFDGSSDENWNYYNKDSIQRFDIKMPNEAKMYNVRTPVYTVGYRFEASKNEDKIIFISGVETVNKLYIYNYAYTSIEDFRAYLAENPLEVYYELAEPVISELYFTDITYKLNEPLRSLPNGVCDTIEENRLVQRVGKVVLDGSNTTLFSHTLDTQNSLTTTVRFYITVSSSIFNCVDNTVDSNNIFMANFPLRNGAHGDYEYIAVQVMSASSVYKIFLNINRDKLESVDVGGLKKWLEQTPITIYYPLANPIETEITPDKIPPFLLKEGLTTLKSTNNITPQIELDCLVRDGFQNLCDNVWERGNISDSTGLNTVYNTRIRLVNYIEVKPNTLYRIDIINNVQPVSPGNLGVRYYNISKEFIKPSQIGNISKSVWKFTTPANCYYIRFIAETIDTNFKIYLKEVIE